MVNSYDVIVIGVGLSGLTAAVRLAQEGARVAVLAKGVGATHLSGATIDILGYTPERVERPLDALGRFLERAPDHPYARIGAETIERASEWFLSAVPGYVGSVRENFLLPSAIGVSRPSALVPETMAGGDLRGGRARTDAGGRDAGNALTVAVGDQPRSGGGPYVGSAPILAVGFRALKDFYPQLFAATVARATGVDARAVTLDLAPDGRADASPLVLARAFEGEGFRGRIVSEIARHRLRPGERVAFPAVLGLADAGLVWRSLERDLDRTVFEVPSLPPSVPGMRVYAALKAALERAGGRILLNNTVVAAERSGDRIGALRVRVGLREQRYRGDQIVLATGGWAGGGLALDSHWNASEVALGLPVRGVPEPAAERFSARYLASHPLGAAGVAVDQNLRPQGLANVVVVGATLAGAEPWREKSGDGISLATGYHAASVLLAKFGEVRVGA